MDAKEWNISGAWIGICRYLVLGGFLMTIMVPRIGNAAACDAAAGYPCTFQIENQEIQKVPTYFKFQSRISQAKIPVGDAVFNSVIVNLKKGNQVLCSETFSRVKVRDSVLNLEIGRGMADSCGELESIIAANNDLKFQICIGDQSNCLKAVDLATVPYAVKASYAATAQKAHTANTAVQCNYAHRLTADRNLFVSQEIGKGYYDFHTPADTEDLEWYDAQSVHYKDGGFIQWAPLGASKNLHICAQDPGTDNPVPLEEFLIHSTNTHMMGVAVIEGSEASDGMTGVKGLQIKRSGLGVAGKADFYDDVAIGGEPETDNRQCDIYHKLDVYGASDFHGISDFRGNVIVEQSAITTVNGVADFNGNTNFSALSTSTHNGPAVFNNNVTVGQTVSASDSQFSFTANSRFVAKGSSEFNGVTVFNKGVFVGDSVSYNTSGEVEESIDLQVKGEAEFDKKVRFRGNVVFEESIEMPAGFYPTPGPDSIDSEHIVNAGVKTDDIAPGAIDNSKLNLSWSTYEETFGDMKTVAVKAQSPSVCFLSGIYKPEYKFSVNKIVIKDGELQSMCRVHRENGAWFVTGQAAGCDYICMP